MICHGYAGSYATVSASGQGTEPTPVSGARGAGMLT